MSIFTNEQAFIFVLFVFQLLNHSDETSTLLGGTAPLLGGAMTPSPPPAGYGPAGSLAYLTLAKHGIFIFLKFICKNRRGLYSSLILKHLNNN